LIEDGFNVSKGIALMSCLP